VVEQLLVLVLDIPEAAMTAPTHAFVGYDAVGTPIEVLVDDGRPATSHAVQYITRGGRIERMTIEDARKVRMYERPAR
jgi:hypothetical protein